MSNLEELTKILETAEGLFRKYGVRSVTMSDIAKELGMSKKTLYLYIKNKEDLISKSLQEHIKRDKEQMQAIIEASKNALHEMVSMNNHVQQLIQDMNPSLLFDLKKYHRNVWEDFERFHQEFIYSCIKNNLERGIEEGLYRANINSDILSKIYIASIPAFADELLFPPNEYNQAHIHETFVDYHLHGIVSEQGKTLLATYQDNH